MSKSEHLWYFVCVFHLCLNAESWHQLLIRLLQLSVVLVYICFYERFCVFNTFPSFFTFHEQLKLKQAKCKLQGDWHVVFTHRVYNRKDCCSKWNCQNHNLCLYIAQFHIQHDLMDWFAAMSKKKTVMNDYPQHSSLERLGSFDPWGRSQHSKSQLQKQCT